MQPLQIKKLLDSRNEREVLDGLRKVIAMMYRSQPSSRYFSSVVKNVASTNLEIKKLVYIYLLYHAEAEPDLALLSINTIQKSLSDGNPQVRAMALKTMSGIRVPVISQIISLAIKKGIADMSPVVRKAAALAIPKCYRLDPSTLPQLIDYLSTLLGDRQYYVAGAAVQAFMVVCPDRMNLIHKHYRGLVKKLVDMDEWSQLATLRLMTVYARKCFPRRSGNAKKSVNATDFYNEGKATNGHSSLQTMDSDLDLLLRSIKPLLQSRNSAVVVAVTRCYVNLGTSEYVNMAIGPLIALLRGPQDIQQVALYNIVTVCLRTPKSFVRYASHFLVHSTDARQVWELKLEILTLIFPHSDPYAKSLVLNELEHFSRGIDKDLVRESVRAIGRCAQSDSRTSARCLRLLLRQITSPDGNLVAEALTVIRHLIQQDPESHANTVVKLAKNLDTVIDSRARATIVWLVGEFSDVDGENNIAADVLRILTKGFADEALPAKLQIVLLAAKVYLHYLIRTPDELEPPKHLPSNGHGYAAEDDEGFQEFNKLQRPLDLPDKADPNHPIVLLWNHILLLARYDVSYDLRDRARLYKALLAVPSSTQLARLMLLAPKPVPHAPSPSESRKSFVIGSASLVVGEEGGGGPRGLIGYEPLPDWVEPGKEPDPKLRDSDVAHGYDDGRAAPAVELLNKAIQSGPAAPRFGTGTAAAGVSSKDKTLDDWLAEDEGSGKPVPNEDEEEEDTESEEEDEEEDDGDEDDDDDDDEDAEDEEEYTSDEEEEEEAKGLITRTQK
jgi:AP-3 complex subunit beta